MPTILTTAFKFITGSAGSLLGGVWIYAIVFAAGLATGGYAIHRTDLVSYQALQLKDAQAATSSLEAQATALQAEAATQHALDLEATAGAVAEAKAQDSLNVRTITITREIPTYVTEKQDMSSCITYGLLRVIDAAALGGNTDPSQLALPAGQSDDACSPIKASDLAASIAGNYGTADANAEQLNALEVYIADFIRKANQ